MIWNRGMRRKGSGKGGPAKMAADYGQAQAIGLLDRYSTRKR